MLYHGHILAGGLVMSERQINTGGGAYIEGGADTGGGDLIGRDKSVQEATPEERIEAKIDALEEKIRAVLKTIDHIVKPCPICKGDGQIVSTIVCPSCGGKGLNIYPMTSSEDIIKTCTGCLPIDDQMKSAIEANTPGLGWIERRKKCDVCKGKGHVRI
jgi:RecJ-like exonuclease